MVLPRGAGEHGQGTGQAGTGSRSRKRHRGRNRAKNRGQRPVSAMQAAPQAPGSPTFPPLSPPDPQPGPLRQQRGSRGHNAAPPSPQPRPPRAHRRPAARPGPGRGAGPLRPPPPPPCWQVPAAPRHSRAAAQGDDGEGERRERSGAERGRPTGSCRRVGSGAGLRRAGLGWAGQPLGAAPTPRTPAPGFCCFFFSRCRTGWWG